MNILSELSPVTYDGIQYASINHALYANITSYPDIKWYLLNSNSEKSIDIVKKNFSFCLSNDEREITNVLNKIIAVKDKDEDFYKRIRDPNTEQPEEISRYLKSKEKESSCF